MNSPDPARQKEIRDLAKSINDYMNLKHGSRGPTLDELVINPNAAKVFDFSLDQAPDSHPKEREGQVGKPVLEECLAALENGESPNYFLPCPFCGSKSIEAIYDDGWEVGCKDCSTYVAPFLGAEADNKQKVINFWNTRACT